MVIGLPILIGELTIGRTTGLNPIGAFAALCPKRSKLADLLGGIILLSGIALITFSQIGWSCFSARSFSTEAGKPSV